MIFFGDSWEELQNKDSCESDNVQNYVFEYFCLHNIRRRAE